MLIQLHIKNIVLIEDLKIDFSSGFSVLTGETGAGKSILLDALSLAVGSRGDGGLVRQGCEQGQVIAVFSLPSNHMVWQVLKDSGFEVEDFELIIRRIQTKDGRSRIFINEQASNVSFLRQIGNLLVEFHGQHSDRYLLDTNTHLAILDNFADLGAKLDSVQAAWHAVSSLRRELSQQEAHYNLLLKEQDYLNSAVTELEKLAIEIGEEEQLAAKRSLIMKAEKIFADLQAVNAIMEGSNSPISQLNQAIRRLERKAGDAVDIIEPLVSQADTAIDSLYSLQDKVEDSLSLLRFNPIELENVEERLFALRAAARKYNTTVDGCVALLDQFTKQLEEFSDNDKYLAKLRIELDIAEKEYKALASALSDARRAAAISLSEAVEQELPALKLSGANFIVNITTNSDLEQANGWDRVEFWVQTNPGAPAGPLMKIASGGELSRFLLALKVVLANKGSVPILIFDEVDSGVSGAVSDAIGQRLFRLANSGLQLLAVTHAPQIAAQADHHFLIAKQVYQQADGTAYSSTKLHLMNYSERIEEIARLLSADKITAEARAAAAKLLERS